MLFSDFWHLLFVNFGVTLSERLGLSSTTTNQLAATIHNEVETDHHSVF